MRTLAGEEKITNNLNILIYWGLNSSSYKFYMQGISPLAASIWLVLVEACEGFNMI